MTDEKDIQEDLDVWASTAKHYITVAFSVAVPLGIAFGLNAGSIQDVDGAVTAAIGAIATFGGPVITSVLHLWDQIRKKKAMEKKNSG